MTSPVFTLSGCITIQGDDDMTFFLQDTRRVYSSAACHVGNARAVSNLAGCRVEEIVIVGHGEPGVLLTANGERRGSEDQFISIRSDLSRLSGPGTLRFVGCQTGAGHEGAALVNAVAQATGRRVLAPVGYVHFGQPDGAPAPGLYLDEGTGWIEASPGCPASAKFTTPSFSVSDAVTIRLRVAGASIPVSFPLDTIESMHWQAYQPDVRPYSSPASKARAATRFIDFSRPFEPGAAAAVALGLLTIGVRTAGGALLTRDFAVYDRLMMDAEFRTVYYRINLPGLIAAL